MAKKVQNKTGNTRCAQADRSLFYLSPLEKVWQRMGTGEGRPENCERRMQVGAYILVYPGGVREIFKPKSEHYTLKWNNRFGFAKLALKHDDPIVPVAVCSHFELFGAAFSPSSQREWPGFDQWFASLEKGIMMAQYLKNKGLNWMASRGLYPHLSSSGL